MSIISFKEENGKLVAIFEYDYIGRENIIDRVIMNKGTFVYHRTFFIDYSKINTENDNYGYEVIIGEKRDNYYLLDKEIFDNRRNFYINASIPNIDEKIFFVRKTSLIKHITNLLNEDFYLEPNFSKNIKHNHMEMREYRKLIKTFPNQYELDRYTDNIVSSVLSNYFNVDNYKLKYENYINKHRNYVHLEDFKTDYELIIGQSKSLLDILEDMLNDDSISENDWQQQIINFIKVLFPKYVYCFNKINIKDVKGKTKQIDLLLVDANGYVDVIEIKKASVGIPLTKTNYYRSNYIPVRELSGTIIQIENYIYCLSSNKKQNELILNDKKPAELNHITLKINNPKGIIIYGRSNSLNEEQYKDFEILKRNHKDILDIITYDDLILRLKNTIFYYESFLNK